MKKLNSVLIGLATLCVASVTNAQSTSVSVSEGSNGSTTISFNTTNQTVLAQVADAQANGFTPEQFMAVGYYGLKASAGQKALRAIQQRLTFQQETNIIPSLSSAIGGLPANIQAQEGQRIIATTLQNEPTISATLVFSTNILSVVTNQPTQLRH